MYNDCKKTEVCEVKQKEDKSARYDYTKINIDMAGVLRGTEEEYFESR